MALSPAIGQSSSREAKKSFTIPVPARLEIVPFRGGYMAAQSLRWSL
ncbi:MAG TPA: hypothetical protein VGY31_06755 [Terriglobia bacterium]|nr:hypothetical protein [Terriglobia bacterium]